MTPRAPAAILLTVAAAGCLTRGYRSKPRVAVVDGDPIVQVARPGQLPSLSRPRLVPADRRFDVPDASARVLGIHLEGSPRAYPIGLLDRYEVVNDAVSERPFVVTRCALTGVAAVFDRRAGGSTLVFDNSGALWRDTLVLRDRETGTYWSAATGRAISGPLEGESLARVPAAFARLEDWERLHPDSLYLDQWTRTSPPWLIQIYGLSPWQGISGEKTDDARYKPKQEVFVVPGGENEALAFSGKELKALQTASVDVGGEAVRLGWDPGLQAPRAYAAQDAGEEIAVVPMYWFAVARHYSVVRSLPSR